MLNPAEKAYCLALDALRHKDYKTAVEFFDRAAPFFEENREFALFRETTQLLVALQKELAVIEQEDSILEIEEVFSSGQEADIR